MKQDLGLYVHIPFCIQKCLYCDFCSFPKSGSERMETYVKELCRRLTEEAPRCAAYRVDTLYFGGGTPTLLPLSCWESLLACIRGRYELSDGAEITCECNPATVDAAYLSALRHMGINRLSIGLQSVHDRELALLGRAHTYEEFLTTFHQAREAGFDNISVDLMYGIPDQTLDSFRQSLHTVAVLSPEHISAYGLKIEDGTPFARAKDRLSLPDEDTEFSMYEAMTDILTKNGYAKYEISNFAKAGKESRHNLRYWQREAYLGFGVAAHSCFEGERFGNSRDLCAFLAGKDITEERIPLRAKDERNEYLLLGLRLVRGIGRGEFRSRFGVSFERAYPQTAALIAHGYLKAEEDRIAFTDKGFFVSNAILTDLLIDD